MGFGDRFTDTDATPIEPRGPGPGRRYSLLVIGDGFVDSHPLPEAADLIIGRSSNADICIDLQNISRRHALLHVGETVLIEDLGSANGTRVHDRELARGEAAAVKVGDVIELGSVMLIVQDSAASARPRRIFTHSYFEARLEEECARAERKGGAFSVLRIRTAQVDEILLAALRPGDILASYGPNEYEVLLVDMSIDDTNKIVQRIRQHLSPQGVPVVIGVAHYPGDGRVPEALMAKACGDVEGRERAPSTLGGNVVVEAGVMKRLHRLVERVAAGSISVLILGETGVGKEIIAERMHTLSPRIEKPLLRINCAALSESLLESELFGHKKGAFTGAINDKPGLLESADGGTVFLDEIGDLPLGLQAKLLRVLEEGRVRRVGSLKDRAINVRIVAATHRNLEAEIARGTFRRDLFFRLNGVSIVIPPLRERTDEIEPLARTFVAAAARRQGSHPPVLSADALALLQDYAWPGNVRELRNVMERAVLLCTDGVIAAEHLPAEKMGKTYETTGLFEVTKNKAKRLPLAAPEQTGRQNKVVRRAPIERNDDEPTALESAQTVSELQQTAKQRERQLVIDALERTGGNQTQAAKLLGISRGTLIARIKAYGLPRPRKRSKS